MRAKPSSSNSRSSKSSRSNGKSHRSSSKANRNKTVDKKNSPDLSVLRQPVDTSISGLRQAVKVFETGTPEVLDLLTYDCDVVYECKVCRNLFRSLANFISHKRVYCVQRYSRSQDLQRSNKQGDDSTIILGEKPPEKLPTRITARRDLTSIVEALGGQKSAEVNGHGPARGAETTVHLEPMDNTAYGVFQTVLQRPDRQDLMRNQVQELQNLLSKNEVVLGPDGRVLQNGLSDLQQRELDQSEDSDLFCSACNIKFANRKTLAKHKRLFHELIRTSYSCPCCKNFFANPWSVYRHLYKVHRKTNEQVRRLRSQIHKKDIRVEKTVANNSPSSKKAVSPTSKKKAELDQRQKFLQHNKEWIGHFEDDLRCGGCARKFERKAALMSHSQICQKRIAACNKVEPNHTMVVQNPLTAVVTLSPLSCSKKPMPKPSPEKKIGIQVRMNYCKSPAQSSGRMLRSVPGDDSDVDAASVDGKSSMYNHPSKNTVDLKESSVLEQFFKDASKCGSSEGIQKVSSYLTNTLDKVGSYEISTCKRSTFLRSNVGKSKSLEAKCLQLRSALESGLTERFKSRGKDRESDNSVYFDGNVDNTSESNTSAISSLSSQLTPLVDKAYIEVEQSIEIKNINISRTLETPCTEADSTSMNGGLHMTYNSRTYTGNIKFSPTKEATCGEVSTSDGIPHRNMDDDEVSVSLKPVSLKHEIKNWSPGSEFGNTISILTRNQLKAICKDDSLPIKEEKKVSSSNNIKIKAKEMEVESITKEIMRKRFPKYFDWERRKCCICNTSFKKSSRPYSVFKHIRRHTLWKRYECLFNGCSFQNFFKQAVLNHIQDHKNECNVKPLDSLVGLIDQSKWNLKLVKTPKPVARPKNPTKVVKANQIKVVASKKLDKTVQGIAKKTVKPVKSEKPLNKPKNKVQNGVTKIKIAAILKKNNRSKQKLLTDFKSFTAMNRLNGKSVPQKKKTSTEESKSVKRKNIEKPVQNSVTKKLKSSPVQNGVHKNEASIPEKKSPKKKSPANSPDQRKGNLVKKEMKGEEIIVNHITLSQESNSDATIAKGRGSRTSSRKSSANSVDHQKAKSLINAVIKNEDSNTLCTPVAYESINSAHIIDSSSLEEEESQESDRPVDDSHLKKIFMEVIFGSTPSPPVLSPGRPVRNKSRPKRDSDFILGSQKEPEKDGQEVKTTLNKKGAKSSDSKLSLEGNSNLRKTK